MEGDSSTSSLPAWVDREATSSRRHTRRKPQTERKRREFHFRHAAFQMPTGHPRKTVSGQWEMEARTPGKRLRMGHATLRGTAALLV